MVRGFPFPLEVSAVLTGLGLERTNLVVTTFLFREVLTVGCGRVFVDFFALCKDCS